MIVVFSLLGGSGVLPKHSFRATRSGYLVALLFVLYCHCHTELMQFHDTFLFTNPPNGGFLFVQLKKIGYEPFLFLVRIVKTLKEKLVSSAQMHYVICCNYLVRCHVRVVDHTKEI